jgi:hypothetical protein
VDGNKHKQLVGRLLGEKLTWWGFQVRERRRGRSTTVPERDTLHPSVEMIRRAVVALLDVDEVISLPLPTAGTAALLRSRPPEG